MASTNYKLLIFDWDGTLIDSEQSIVSCMQASILDVGNSYADIGTRTDAQIRHIIGLGLYEALEVLFPKQTDRIYAELIDRYRAHFFKAEPSRAFPQVEATLIQLQDAGFLMAVATGKGRRGLDLAMQQAKFDHFFVASRCADETQSKPHPQMLQELLAQLDLEPNQALMIGDTSYDLDMATKANIDSVAVCTGVHDKTRLLQCHPTACLEAVPKLVDWLEI